LGQITSLCFNYRRNQRNLRNQQEVFCFPADHADLNRKKFMKSAGNDWLVAYDKLLGKKGEIPCSKLDDIDPLLQIQRDLKI